MRINKFLAKAGLGSRRSVEKLILSGKIKVNDIVIKDLSTRVEATDKVFYENREIIIKEDYVYYMINKPIGVTTSLKDPYAEKLIVDCIDDDRRIYPVGRLDKDSCGLIFLTNDGDFTYRMTHPKYNLSKTYRVKVNGHPKSIDIKSLEEGIVLDGYKTKSCKIREIKRDKDTTSYEVILWEGRNRQIRKLFDSIVHPVLFLQRIKIGPIELKGLNIGLYRELSSTELKELNKELYDSIKRI